MPSDLISNRKGLDKPLPCNYTLKTGKEILSIKPKTQDKMLKNK